MSKEMVKKNIVSVIEDEAFVPLNEFELEECRKLVALTVAIHKSSMYLAEFNSMIDSILSESTRFCSVVRVSKENFEPLVRYEGYQYIGDYLNYIRCNNGMILFFNNKAELVART